MTEDNRSQTADTCPEDKTMEPVKRDMDALAGEPAAAAGQDPGEAGTNAPAERTKAAAAAGKHWTGDPEQLYHAINTVKDAVNHIQEIKEAAKGWPDVKEIDGLMKELESLEPYILQELEQYPEYKNLSFQEFLEGFTLFQFLDLANSDSNIAEILNNAREARDTDGANEEQANFPTVTYTNKPGIELTTDKLMTVFFGANAPAAPRGQIPGQMTFIPVKYEKTGAPEITLYYTYSFDNDLFNRLKLEKKIDDEDYFILSFIASYWREGQKSVSVCKLYKDMTGDNPNNKQLTTLTNRLIKIAGTNIFINDKDVRKAWNIEDENKTYREILAPLAPIKVGAERFISRGQVVEAGIEILAEPDIMKLGYEMGQYTTISKKLLHVKKRGGRKLSRTPRFYKVLHFLIRRIAAIKSGNLSSKILYESFYDEIGETMPRGRQLARDCMYTILDHFKECSGWITGYKEETSTTTGKVGVNISCTVQKKITTKKK